MNKMILILVLAAIVVVAWACKPSGNDAFKTVGVDEFEALIANKDSVVTVDVRTPSEYAEGHIAGALLIDIKGSSFMEEALKQLPKEKTIAVYCRSGRRSANAAGKLADKGYKVVNLDGGIMAWKRAGKLP